MNTTRAAVLVRQNEPLQLVELRLPDLLPGQVLVDIAWSGVCHTQLNEWSGRRGPDPYLPHTLGHEGAGRIAAAGRDVTKVRPGDHVVVTWIKGIGADVPGTVYESAIGPVNSGAVSTFMERAVIAENRVVPIAPDMPLREAALLGCAIPTGAGIVLNSAGVRAGSSVCIFGAGGIGLSALLAAHAVGAAPIIVIDILPEKLAKARELGADLAINSAREDAVAAVHAATGGTGVDLAIEAAGSVQSMEAAFRATRRGGLCVLAGNLAHGETIRIDPFELIAGKRLVGSWGGGAIPDRDIPDYVRRYRDGTLPLGQLISRDYRLEEINDAMRDLQDGRVVRALIAMAE
jgi:S-(hydroxymethyl)glutathione dehydrogenase / alcohol dehydrogenase